MTESSTFASSVPWGGDFWQSSLLNLLSLQIWERGDPTSDRIASTWSGIPYEQKSKSHNKKQEEAFGKQVFESKRHIQDDDLVSQLSRRWFVSNGGSTKFSLFTRQGRKGKINQDAMIAWEELAERTVLCAVFDGHGKHGHLVAHSVRETLPHLVARSWRNRQAAAKEEQEGTSNSSTDAYDHIFAWKGSFLNAYREMDERLIGEDLDSKESGTTAVTLVRQGNDLFIANVGDSRAVLGIKADDGSVSALQLTVDLTPKEPREAERIRRHNGEVFSLPNEPSVPRVWLPKPRSPGLAMSRSLGDHCFKNHGVISEPEVTYRQISQKDQFVVLATDGVWNVLTNEEVVETVVSKSDRSAAAKAVVQRAESAWKAMYAASRMDDCTVVCLFL